MEILSRKSDKGFTLIELLVVIAIIGILSTVVLASLGTARSKARDARRLSDLRQMANLVASLGEGTAFAGCTVSGLASGCTTPTLTAFSDPTGTTVCAAGALSATCNYRVAKRSAAGNPNSTDWQICGYIENATGAFSSGAVHVGDDTNYSIAAGGCTN